MRNLLIVIAAAALLNGCYSSNRPFITPASADYPFPDGTRYIDHSEVEGVKTARLRGGYYFASNTNFLVKAIGGGFYVVQSCEARNSAPGCDYALLKVEGKTIKRYDGGGTCAVDDCPVASWDELVSSMRRDYEAGEQFVLYDVQ